MLTRSQELLEGELQYAKERWSPIRGAHEGISLIWEELDEYREEVRRDQRGTNTSARAELIQVAAMAIRTLQDVYF